jgi:alkylation response protein AidB-like acyl-CoA dehydrogenase
LDNLLKKDDSVWQGATWMTEIKGGSDLGANVETTATPNGDHYFLNGEKYFCSNAHAEVAVVAARIEGAPKNIKGLALFLVPRTRDDGTLNYTLDRLKDKIATHSVPTGEVTLKESIGYLLGPETGIYQIMEVLNISRTANCMASVALAQRALFEAYQFAKDRVAFGKPIIEQPLLKAQFEQKFSMLNNAFALAWETVVLLDEVWLEKPPYSERYHLFRLMAHLGKYWTAENAVQTAKWAMEVNGGLGTLHEFPVERWLREAMILSIWEGTPHRQILDGIEVMEQKEAHLLLLSHLAPYSDATEIDQWGQRISGHLGLSQDEKEAQAESLFSDLAAFTANRLLYKNSL